MINKLIAKIIPIFPKSFIFIFAKKYIAGEKLEDAVNISKEFTEKGGLTTIDTLGEFVTSRQKALRETDNSRKVLDEIHKNSLPSYLSIKPTSVGLDIDFDFAYDNIRTIVKYASDKNLFVRLDMENSPYTDSTLKIYKKIRDEGFDNIGFVLQAYLKRSKQDILDLKAYKPSTRLCKGIYNESKEIAYKDKQKIRDNYKELLELMIEEGYYPAIATHDVELLDFAEDLIAKHNLKKSQYEFQMLLGVTERKRDELLEKGHNIRIYIPYGKDWFGYSIRRMQENPQMVGHIIKSIFTRK